MKYLLDIPYPQMDHIEPHIEYGQMILSHLGGINSEMSAISLYFYNHIITKDTWKELSEAMQQISFIEMKHLDILAELCYRLGIDPRLWACHDDSLQYWSPGYNIYPRQIHTILENAIEDERTAIALYQSQIDYIQDENIQMILNRIILDEQFHLEIFENFLQQYHQQKDNYYLKQFE